MRKSKNRYFHHIFVSPGDAPGTIMLNVVWMEREFDAYKLSRCMCRSNYYRFWDTARYLWKIVILSYPPCIWRPSYGGSRRNIGTPFGTETLEWCCYPMVKKFRRYVYSFWSDPRTWQTDRQTLHDSEDRAYASHRAVKTETSVDIWLNIATVVARSPPFVHTYARTHPCHSSITLSTRTVLTRRVSSYGLPAWVSSELGPMGGGHNFTTSAAALEPGHY